MTDQPTKVHREVILPITIGMAYTFLSALGIDFNKFPDWSMKV